MPIADNCFLTLGVYSLVWQVVWVTVWEVGRVRGPQKPKQHTTERALPQYRLAVDIAV
jgi:hypothetical protein